jgi:hypothetical protein
MADPLPPTEAAAVLAAAEKDAQAAAEKAAAGRNAALQYVAQALNDYSNTLAPSVRGPFLRESQAALDALKG